MKNKKLPETSIVVYGDRYSPVSVFAQTVKTIAASGVVDDIGGQDQLSGFIPPMLWNTGITPLAAAVPDIDSCTDGFAMLAYATALAPDSKFSMMADATRHPPVEMVQSMLTVANITEGRVTYSFGGGEVKNLKPNGWNRAEGLARLEDLFKIFHLFWNSKPGELVSYDGNHIKLKNTSLGGARRFRPKLWGLGGGPKLIDLVTTYCDGISVATPCAWDTPEIAAEQIAGIKQKVADKGRDPEAFTIGICCPIMLHDDRAVIDKALDNPVSKWLAAVYGRIDPADWGKYGIKSPWPEGWNYFLKMLPFEMTPEFVNEVMSKIPRELVERASFNGTPAQVAGILQKYVDAGVDWVQTVDYFSLVLSPEEAAKQVGRSIELCAHLKGKAAY